MGECVVKIERMQNGFEVEMKDPEIIKANMKPSKGSDPMPYKDPNVSYVFKTSKEVLAFLEANLDKTIAGDEYESSFDEAAAEEEGED